MFLSLILYIKGKRTCLFDCNPRALRAGLHVPSAIKSFTVYAYVVHCSRSPHDCSDKISALSHPAPPRYTRVALLMKLILVSLNFKFDMSNIFTPNYSFSRRRRSYR
jgi:hypothetical protein